MNIEKKGMVLNKREYLGPVWPADVWQANDIPLFSRFTYFQYSLIHDLAPNLIHRISSVLQHGKAQYEAHLMLLEIKLVCTF